MRLTRQERELRPARKLMKTGWLQIQYFGPGSHSGGLLVCISYASTNDRNSQSASNCSINADLDYARNERTTLFKIVLVDSSKAIWDGVIAIDARMLRMRHVPQLSLVNEFKG